MDNQKPNDGNARNLGSAGSGGSMGKDLSREMGSTDHTGSKSVGFGDLDKTLDKVLDNSTETSTTTSLGTQDTTFSSANIDKTLDKTASSAHSTIDKAAEAAAPMAERLATTAHAGVDKVSSALSGVTGNLGERSKQLTDAYGKFAETGRDYVRTSPATSVMIALAAGYTLSKIFGGRR